jgi:hypothetical protein
MKRVLSLAPSQGYNTRPAAASRPRPLTRLPRPVTIAAPADEVAEAPVVEAEPEIAVIVPVVLEELLELVKSCCFVHVAVKPVALEHALPIVLFEPETKLTGAH